ncbi:MAG: hypothetical protein MRZ79_07730 [Bacteroidia bacterium]|nr:hypothetical protein [Bacteroidia bacterium]
MNYLSSLRGVLILATISLLYSCCTPCQKENLGQFTVKEELKDWFEFAETTQSYRSTSGETVVLDYGTQVNGFTPQFDNCEEINRCGLCCDEFEAEFIGIQARDPELEFLIEIVITKDFLKHNPDEGNENVSEVLEIRMNNMPNFTCRLEDIQNAELVDVVTLNGSTFANVWTCEDEVGTIVANQTQVTAIYFTKSKGLVGWRLGQNEIYSLF